jgi:hypothetical protein
MTVKWTTRKRAQFYLWVAGRNSSVLDYTEAAETFSLAVLYDMPASDRTLVALADRAVETAPNQQLADLFRSYRNAIRAGRKIKVKEAL